VSGPADITPNDLWAIHDLLLVGYDGYFMKKDSPGHAEAQEAAAELARLLPHLHPHLPCREMLTTAMARYPPVPRGPSEAYLLPQPAIVEAAEAAWRCLPAAFTVASFTASFSLAALQDDQQAQQAKDPNLRDHSVLGACLLSKWPRTCSYWASIHGMALRADALGLGAPFLRAIVPILASGATMCGGCTLHFRALHRPVLSSAMIQDLGALS